MGYRLYIIDITMIPNNIQTIHIEICNLLLNEVHKLNYKHDTRGCKNKYDRKLFIKAFIKRLKNCNTWLNLQDEFNISKTHLHRIFMLWYKCNLFKKVL
jgi:hypothetical protein